MIIAITYLTPDDLTEEVVQDISELLRQLSSRPIKFNLDALRRICASSTVMLLAWDANRVIGTISLVFPTQLCGGKVWAEDLVVHKDFRRQGVAERQGRPAAS